MTLQYMYLRLTYHDRLPTYRLAAAALDGAIKRLCERYPQLKRVIRLPLGRDEHLITEDFSSLQRNQRLNPAMVNPEIYLFEGLCKNTQNPVLIGLVAGNDNLVAGRRVLHRYRIAAGLVPDEMIAATRRVLAQVNLSFEGVKFSVLGHRKRGR